MASVVPAPPRPPNPELLHSHALLHAKLQQRLQYIQTSAEESNAQLNLLSEDLDRGDLAIKDEMARLEAVRDVCKVTGDELQGAVDMASQRLDELRKKEEPDFDGLLSATSLVGNQ
jgi:ESCRT-I complex subunit TSG101